MEEHGHWQKQTLFDNATKIPLIISVPGLQNSVITNTSPVELIDFYPTLMELIKPNIPKNVVGKSLSPILQQKTEYVRDNALTRWVNGYSIKTNRHRITQCGKNGEIGYELYDHKLDQREMGNLAEKPEYLLDSQIIC